MIAKVFELDNQAVQESKMIFKSINTFLSAKKLNSVNTKSNYERNIRQFFQHTRRKGIDQLNLSDLIFTLDDIQEYQVTLSKKYKNKTVNNKMYAIRSLYKYLDGNDYNVKLSWFNVENLKDYDSEGYEVINWGTVESMIEMVKTHKNGLEKALFIELGAKTSFRLETLLTLKWTNFHTDSLGTRYVKVLGKGKEWDKKPIQEELYDRLLELKVDGSEKVFQHLNNRQAASRMMTKLCKELGLDSKKVKFHSMKKAGMHEVNLITGGNIKAIQQQGNHKSELTPLKFYTKVNENLSEMPCLQIGQQINTAPLEELSKEELLNLITNSGREVQIKLLAQLNKKG